MIGDDKSPAHILNSFSIMEAGVNNATDPKQINENPKGVINGFTYTANARRIILGKKGNGRKNKNCHKYAAKTKEGKGEARPDQPPDII